MKEKILLLCASPNKGGNSSTLGQWFLSGINKEHYEVEEICLYDLTINYCCKDNYKPDLTSEQIEADVKMLFAKMQESKYIVITSPVWNFGIPAVLKNILDRLSYFARPWSEEKKTRVPAWGNKKFYLLFSSGAPKFGIFFNLIAFLQIRWTLSYYGARKKIVGLAFDCGSGKENLVNDRVNLKKKIIARGKKIFK